MTSRELPLLIGRMMNVPKKQEPEGENGDGDGAWKAGQAITLGTNIAVGMGLFTFAGYYADKKNGGGYLWTLCGMGLGLVYGAYEIWKVIKILNSGNGKGGTRPRKDLNAK